MAHEAEMGVSRVQGTESSRTRCRGNPTRGFHVKEEKTCFREDIKEGLVVGEPVGKRLRWPEKVHLSS